MSEPDEHAHTLREAALDAVGRGDLTAAIASLRQAYEAAPGDLPTLLVLGDLLRRVGALDEARAALEAGKQLAPNDAAFAFQLGRVYRIFGELDAAGAEFGLVLKQQPAHKAAREALVLVEIAQRDYEAASGVAGAAPTPAGRSELFELISVEAVARGDFEIALRFGRLAFEGEASAATAMTLARAEFHVGADADAERRLHWVLAQPDTDSTLRARAEGTLADIADRRGDFAHAFPLYASSKRLMKQAYEQSSAGRPGSFRDTVTRLAASAAGLPDAPPSSAPAPSLVARHAFLLGFPRTGTTLIEQCLGGHPDVTTSDESDALRATISPLLNETDPFASIKAMAERDLETIRAAYWRGVGQRAPVRRGGTFIDKMPFNSVYAGFIPFLFPDAKIILALRDPRDVVFSCFRRRFAMNSATYELCTLEGAVRLFCAVMQLFDAYRSKTPMAVIECRYEDAVRDLRATGSRLCDFIGIEWCEEMAHFSDRARRHPLSSASAPQLAQGLFLGAGSWRGYQTFLSPYSTVLAPWVARFGYAAQ